MVFITCTYMVDEGGVWSLYGLLGNREGGEGI